MLGNLGQQLALTGAASGRSPGFQTSRGAQGPQTLVGVLTALLLCHPRPRCSAGCWHHKKEPGTGPRDQGVWEPWGGLWSLRAAQKREFTGALNLDTLSTSWAGRRKTALQEEKPGQRRGGCYAGCMAMWEGGKGGSCREPGVGRGCGGHITPTRVHGARPVPAPSHLLSHLVLTAALRGDLVMNLAGRGDSTRGHHWPVIRPSGVRPAAWLPRPDAPRLPPEALRLRSAESRASGGSGQACAGCGEEEAAGGKAGGRSRWAA